MEDVPVIWESKKPANPPHRAARRTLYVPIHSWERDVIDLRRRVESLAGILDPAATTVLLGWGDFLSRGTRDAYRDAGFNVECNGYRGGAVAPESPIGDRGIFLHNLLRLLLSVDVVVSEEMCTALIYAASIGRSVRVDQAIQEVTRVDVTAAWSNYRSGYAIASDLDAVHRDYSWALDPDDNVFDHQRQVKSALGGDCLMSPEQLQQALEWEAT